LIDGEASMPEERLTAESQRVGETARMLRCLGHPIRLLILDLLEREGELTVTDIHERLELEQAIASQHLSLMRDRGILKRRKEGVHAYYRIGDDRAMKVLSCVRGGMAS